MAARTRRSTAEVRHLLVDAAARVFTAKGYASTTADDIAAEAGVARSAIWRHFTDKADLFGAAVLQPFMEFLENYTVAYDIKNPKWGDFEITRTIVEMFYDSCTAHREALVGVAVVGHELDSATLAGLDEQFDRFFAEIMRTTSIEAHRRGWVPQAGLGLTMRLLFGTIASIVVFDHPLVPSGSDKPSRHEVIDHVTRVFLYGARLAKD
ncbi:TetR family transcriptional regulator [Mycobacterium sp.]|uniref:TetR family transcriptional regulator n=1 Tax=Mycobacterium sp. TaxID=1785 RepID=UPI00120401C3|nr:TetR family transcriptional regulator [Mycobacterium sp.]TAM65656.1 MAG: TetR family transcriptional regulator [Mycobacterium sp.]